ncbi:MAG: ferrous iron transport protein A [Deltaproteobacteria bacterium]|nr:ferrous iron transport protein A [Deltaproteobacteria bacterium]
MTLDQIPQGCSVRVQAVAGDDPVARRLEDLGLREGVRIEMIRRAPLGDPTVFELCGYQLCLRRTESARVRVEPIPRSAAMSPAVDPTEGSHREVRADAGDLR